MTDAERDALAERALKLQKSSRKRAKEFRDRKRADGLVQLSVWVDKNSMSVLRKIYQDHADKYLSDKKEAQANKAAKKETSAPPAATHVDETVRTKSLSQ